MEFAPLNLNLPEQQPTRQEPVIVGKFDIILNSVDEN